MDNEVFEKLIKFIKKERWDYDFPLTRDTTIENKLQITGDDAVDFIIAYGKAFSVDVSKFMAADYFNAEGVDLIGLIFRSIIQKKKREKKILTVGHLEKAIIAGRLDEEVIKS